MWIIKDRDDSASAEGDCLPQVLDALVARMLNVEHGRERFLPDLSPGDGAPIVVSDGALRFRMRASTGFIYCALRSRTLEELKNDLVARLSDFSVEHLSETLEPVEGVATTVTRRRLDPVRAIVTADSEDSSDAGCPAFTWVLSTVNESLFSANLYYDIRQVLRSWSSILLDADNLFTYANGAFVERASASKMAIPKLPEPLALAAQAMDAGGVSLLVDQDSCQIEFVSHAGAMLCTRMDATDLAPRGDVLWKRVRNKMVFQTACERDCYVCRFPVRDYGLVVKGVRVVRDDIPETLIDVYCSYVDPIVAHFNDHHNAYILVCKHCMRIIRNLSEAPVRMDYYATYFDDYEYVDVCEENHMLTRYAFLLRAAEIGRDSRAVKVNDQFWVADRRDYRNVFMREQHVRDSRLPFMQVSLFFYDSVIGYY
jgi:transcription elongation factor Elf1